MRLELKNIFQEKWTTAKKILLYLLTIIIAPTRCKSITYIIASIRSKTANANNNNINPIIMIKECITGQDPIYIYITIWYRVLASFQLTTMIIVEFEDVEVGKGAIFCFPKEQRKPRRSFPPLEKHVNANCNGRDEKNTASDDAEQYCQANVGYVAM
jgi:hypothetical protein